MKAITEKEPTAKEVEDFILCFSKFGNDVKRAFIEGCCYWFAYILKERFAPNARIICLPQEGHFVTKIGEKYYDITGNVTKRYQKSQKDDWEEYQRYNSSRAQKIAKNCVLKMSITTPIL